MKCLLGVVASVVILAASSNLAAQTWALGQPAPAGTGVTSYTGGGWNLGYIFTAGSPAPTVTHLGACGPATGTRIVTLWAVSTQAVLGQVTTASGAAGQWRSGQLSTPVTLTTGQQYVV